MSDGVTNFLIYFIWSFTWIYDILTFPVYAIFQKPWAIRQFMHKKKSRHLVPGDPSSPVVQIIDKDPIVYSGIPTYAHLFEKVAKEKPHTNVLGRRPVYGEEKVIMPNGKVLKKLDLGNYEWLNFTQANERINNLAKGLLEIGTKPKQMLTIYAETRREWMLTAQACFKINVPIVTIYATLGEEGVIHGMNETETSYIFTSASLIPRIKKNIDKLPNVTHIVYMEGVSAPDLSDFSEKVKVMSFSEFESMGQKSSRELREDMKPTKDDMAVLMYTSGSTGTPKGVVINHEQLMVTVEEFANLGFREHGETAFVAYLPLSHIYELCVELSFMSRGLSIGYSSPVTLTSKSTGIKKGCPGDVELLKPTISSSVPLILDRIRKNVTDDLDKRGVFVRAFFQFAVKYKTFWYKIGYSTPVLNSLIFNKTKQIIGGKCELMICGGAPVSEDTQNMMQAILCVDFIQGYGMTETTGCATISLYRDRVSGIVGPPLKFNQIKMVDWSEGNYSVNDKPNPRGEIIVGGKCVAQGYFKRPELTEESFKDENGMRWFYTGDIGELLPDGNFKIIDRKKDLVKLQFGEYISLSKVEVELKTCPLVENICVVGNSFNTFLVALVSPNKTYLKNLAKQVNKDELALSELCKDPQITSMCTKNIMEWAKKCNLTSLEIPSKYKICSDEWLPDSGLVTAAYKIRRKIIEQYYQKDIDELYGISSSS